MFKKSFSILFSLIAILVLGVSNVSAHASIAEKTVGVGARQVFTLGVPNEEDVPTTVVRLVIPQGLKSVTPNAKPGWTIEIKKGEGEGSEVTEVTWRGSLPSGQRDEFRFQAQAPAEETNLVWKAYQTYADGDTVAWENDPKVVADYTKNNPPKEGEDDHNAPRPWSETKVINDLKASAQPVANTNNTGTTVVAGEQNNNTPMILSIIAVLLSAGSFGLQWFRRPSKKSY